MQVDKPIELSDRCRTLTPWELPSLLTPGYAYRYTKRKVAKDRPHFPAILGFVYRNRFAVASQIRRRFADCLRSDRTTRRHLEEMQALGYVAVAPTRSTGPLWPKVYYVTGRGVRKLRESLFDRGKSWKPVRIDRRSRNSNEGYAARRIVHEILITEFLLAVWQTAQGREDLELLAVERRSLVKHSAFRIAMSGRQTRLEPDSMFLFREKGRGMMCCFVEMDAGTMNLKQLRTKFRRYEAWCASENGREYLIDLYRRHGACSPSPTFRILWIAKERTGTNDFRRLRSVTESLCDFRSSLSRRIWLTTVEDLRLQQHDRLPLEASIWRRIGGPGSNQGKQVLTAYQFATVETFPNVFKRQTQSLFTKPSENPTAVP